MKTILCYGDSNTFGYNPVDGGRYAYDKRWTTILNKQLGSEYLVIPEGLNGRTTAFDRDGSFFQNGYPYLAPCLTSHKPLDVVPATVLPDYKGTPFEDQLDDKSIEKTHLLVGEYKKIADKYGCTLVDCTDSLEVSKLDCEHLTEAGHKQLAEILYTILTCSRVEAGSIVSEK